MTDKPVGVGIIGVGGIALEHMKALRASSQLRLIGVTDMDIGRASEVAHLERCESYPDVAAMLAAEEVEAVIVCTPNFSHAELGRQVLEADKHLLMEKPLAMHAADAAQLAEMAAQRGLALAVGHSHRFSDQGIAISEVIESGAIGTPRFVRIVMNGGWIWPGWQAWVLNPEASGGHSLHNGVHLSDLASWWIGEPAESVFSVGQKATSAALGIYDYLVMELSFPSGATAVCEVSRGERPRGASFLEMTVVGSEGVLSREWDANGLLMWNEAGIEAPAPDGTGLRVFVRELESFAAAVRGQGQVTPPVSAAVHAVQVAEASERSLALGQTVRITDISKRDASAMGEQA